MDISGLTRTSEFQWEIPATGAMRVPVVIFADETLIRDMDAKVFEQAANVAALPGIVKASFAMHDAPWGYGFPIGGVAAFDADPGALVSAGGLGFRLSCGVPPPLSGPAPTALEAFASSLSPPLFPTHTPAVPPSWRSPSPPATSCPPCPSSTSTPRVKTTSRAKPTTRTNAASWI